MIKNFCAIIFLIVASFGLASAAPSASNEKFLDAAVFDNTNSLSSAEIKNLTAKIHDVEGRHGVKIGVEILESVGAASMDTAAKSLLERHYSGAPNGGIILLIVMDTHKWQIATDSAMRARIPNLQGLGDGIVGNLKAGDFAGACESYVSGVDRILNYYEQTGAAYDPSDGFNPLAAMVAVCGGIFFGIGVRSWLIGSMTNVHHAAAATDYLKRETVKFDTNRDTYLFTNVQRVAKTQGGGGHGGGGPSGAAGGGGGGAGGSF